MVSDEQRIIDKEIDTLLPFGLCLQDKNDQRKLRATVKTPIFLLWSDHFPPAQRSLGWDHFHFFLFCRMFGGRLL